MKPKHPNSPTLIGFFLIPQFSMLSMSAAVEPLRIANRLSGSILYEWSFYSKHCLPVRASNGVEVAATRDMKDTDDLDALIVVAGIDVENHNDPALSQWLRRLSRSSTTLGSTSTGSLLLARAKLLQHSPCTIHWENIDSFKEEFPLLNVTGELYEMDTRFMTCSGGLSGLDMMLQLITQQHGLKLAKNVAEQCIHPSIRDAHAQQRMATQARLSIHHTEDLISQAQIASRSSLSLRQMERLFKHHFGLRPAQYYLDLRLTKAQLLLQQTSLSSATIASACGFNSTSYLAKRYRMKFLISPRQERIQQQAQQQNGA
jgi:transcriptional regulator GlxA family with amidase domain